MCGRTRLAVPPYDLADAFDVDPAEVATMDPTSVVNLNCAPTDPVLVVRAKREGEGRELALMRWGLVPFYVRDPRDAKPLINARVETVATSRAFRDSYKKRRCLVVADGFYEWRHDSADPRLSPRGGKKKLPHVIQRPDHAPFGFAAIWDRWKDAHRRIESCAILTRAPSEAVAAVHDRMPLALDKADHAAWLDPSADDEALDAVLARAVTDWIVAPIERVPDPPGKKQLRLF